MIYQGNDQFTIQDGFDFNYDPNGSFARNAGTLAGGMIFGRVYDIPVPLPFLWFNQPNLSSGGPFPLRFRNTITIR